MKRLNSILWGMALVDVVYHCSCGDCDYRYENEVFEGAELNAVFGGVKCDLQRNIRLRGCVR